MRENTRRTERGPPQDAHRHRPLQQDDEDGGGCRSSAAPSTASTASNDREAAVQGAREQQAAEQPRRQGADRSRRGPILQVQALARGPRFLRQAEVEAQKPSGGRAMIQMTTEVGGRQLRRQAGGLHQGIGRDKKRYRHHRRRDRRLSSRRRWSTDKVKKGRVSRAR